MDDKNYKLELDQMYSSLGVLNVPLDTKCKHCNSCWKGIENRMWNDDVEGYDGEEHFAHLYTPWIGESYNEMKLLVLGVNMNNYGGYDAVNSLAKYAKDAILKGKRKINFGSSEYSGTFYWHRIPAYIVAFLENRNILDPNWGNDDFPSKEDVSKAFDYFAITNSIKCSPKKLPYLPNDKSKPTYQMWNNCGGFILKQEINILKPEIILICGKSDNAVYFNNNILDSSIKYKDHGLIQRGEGRIDGREIEIFVIPHPTSFGGNKVEIMYSLINSFKPN